MSKIALVAVLGIALGWICVGQFQRLQVDIAVASVDRNVAHTTFTLPNLKTPAPAVDML